MMSDAVNLVEAVGGGVAAAMDELHPKRRLVCGPAAKAYSAADIFENSLEIEMMAWERPHGNHSVSCAVGDLQVRRSIST